jgi:hypothetical protein
MTDIVGVTFPIPKEYTSRIFDEGKNVFIKPAILFKNLFEGMTFVIYQSHKDTGFVGSAIIEGIYLNEDPFEFYKVFNDKIFLSKSELQKYVDLQEKWKTDRFRKRGLKKKLWLALELSNIHRYNQIIKPKRFVTVGGAYLHEIPFE